MYNYVAYCIHVLQYINNYTCIIIMHTRLRTNMQDAYACVLLSKLQRAKGSTMIQGGERLPSNADLWNVI